MAQIGYSKKVMEHFMNPRNVGTMEDPDGHGKVGNPIFKPIKPGPKHVMVIFVPLTLGTLVTLNFRHLT